MESIRRGLPLLLALTFCLHGMDPTAADVRYGPQERHVLDFWKAKSSGPAPVLIFFHGGAFKGGDKGIFRNRAEEFLGAGISVVSANYRFSNEAVFPGPMLDGVRVVQFVRSKAKEWNIDPSKVALSGSSAGGTLALWIALHDVLAKPDAGDPIARISTRVSCASVQNAPTSMDPVLIQKEFGATDFGAMAALHGVRSLQEYLTPDKRKQALAASPIEYATKDDPPLFLNYTGDLVMKPLEPGAKLNAWIHHPRFGQLLKQRYDQLGLECQFYYRTKPAPEGAEIAFLQKSFAGGPVAQFIDLLGDPDRATRSAAAFELAMIGPEARTAVPALIRIAQNKEEDKHPRNFAAIALGMIGPDAAAAVPALIAALQETARELQYLRASAAFSLGSIGPAAAAAIPGLSAVAKDRLAPPLVLEAAGFALARIASNTPPAVPRLADALERAHLASQRPATLAVKSADDNVRVTAIRELGEINRDVASALLRALPPADTFYKTPPERPLRIGVEYPSGWQSNQRRTAILFFYNAGWGNGEPQRQFEEQTAYFLKRGAVVARADYRIKTKNGVETPRLAIEDVHSAVRWMRERAGALGIDAGNIVTAGGSGSGHLLASAFYPDESPPPAGVMIYCSDLDDLEPEMLYRMRGAGQYAEVARRMPPTIAFIGTEDPIFPMLKDVAGDLKKLGAPIEIYVAEGGLHGFYKFSPWLEKTTARADEFLRAVAHLPEEPRVPLPSLAQPAAYGRRTAENVVKWRARHEEREKARATWLALRPQTTFIYKRVGDQDLELQVQYPPDWKPADRRAGLLIFEGGGFSPGEGAAKKATKATLGPGQGFSAQADYFAKRGMVVARAGYRKRKRDNVMPEQAVEDAISAMRWFRKDAGALGIDPNRLVSAGGSSGGHLAASLYALTRFAAPDEDAAISSRPDAMLLYYPLLDWLEGGTMQERFLAALGGDQQRAARLSPARQWRSDMPPTLILIGTKDPMYSFEAAFVAKWKAAGAPVDIFVGEGGGHGFSNFSPWLEKTTARADEFLRAHKFLAVEPRADLPSRNK